MAFVSGSPAPLRDVKMVQFGVLSPDEIVSTLSNGFQTFLFRLLLVFLPKHVRNRLIQWRTHACVRQANLTVLKVTVVVPLVIRSFNFNRNKCLLRLKAASSTPKRWKAEGLSWEA